MRPTRDEWAMDLALLTSRRATCLRRQVGCILLNERGHVLATGYNGVASGQHHCNEVTGKIIDPYSEKGDEKVSVFKHACSGAHSATGTNLDGCQAIHAEQNALLQCRDVYSIHAAYTTTSPCITCAKLLLNTSCQRIVFFEAYINQEAKQLWESAGREWVHFKYNRAEGKA